MKISRGFVPEGHRLLAGFPASKAERAALPNVAFWEAWHRPEHFPHWIGGISSPGERLMILAQFVEGMSSKFLEVREEQELVLSGTGGSW